MGLKGSAQRTIPIIDDTKNGKDTTYSAHEIDDKLGSVDATTKINEFIPNHDYKEGEVIFDGTLLYRCLNDYTSTTSLGADIANWKMITDLHSSGSKYVKFSSTAKTTNISWTQVTISYIEGQQNMIDTVNNTLIAPVDGLYLINMRIPNLANNTTSFVTQIKVNGNAIAGTSKTSSLTAFSANSIAISHLKENDVVTFEVKTDTPDNFTGGTSTSEFILLSEDNSDNLIAEAQQVVPTSTVANIYQIIELTGSTNTAVINNNKIILPEDGSYIVHAAAINSAQGFPLTPRNVALRTLRTDGKKSGVAFNSINGTTLISPGLDTLISGKKGDEFWLECMTEDALNNITADPYYTPFCKVGVYKIKSVTMDFTSEQVYADYLKTVPTGTTPLSFDDWVNNLFRKNNLRVHTTLNQTVNIPAVGYSVKLNTIYKSGVRSMLDSNNCFVATHSGMYYFHAQCSFDNSQPDGTCTRLSLVKNGTTISDPTKRIKISDTNFPGGYKTLSSLDSVMYLEKNDYIALCIQASGSMNNTIKSTTDIVFGLINESAPGGYDINKPNTWPANTEIDFGDGLYGYRATGTITCDKLVQSNIRIPCTNTGIVNQGGKWFNGDTYVAHPYTMSITAGSAVPSSANSYCYCDNNGTGFRFLSYHTTRDRNNAPYDVWFTYTK